MECSGHSWHLGAQGWVMQGAAPALAANPTAAPGCLLACSGITSALPGRREAEHITSSEIQALGGFFFRLISQLRCGTDGEAAACAAALAPGALEAPETDGTKPHWGRNALGVAALAGGEGRSPPAHHPPMAPLGHGGMGTGPRHRDAWLLWVPGSALAHGGGRGGACRLAQGPLRDPCQPFLRMGSQVFI